jgi:hypothetical protein
MDTRTRRTAAATASWPAEAARLAVELERRELSWPDARRLWRAMMLSPSIEVCEALLRGESVPVSRLDPLWVQRFGLKR